MYKNILTVLVLLVTHSVLFGQGEEATTKSGKKVILYADGTWKYTADSKTEVKDVKEKKSIIDEPIIMGECGKRLEIIEDPKTNIRTIYAKEMIIVANESSKKEISISLQKGARQVVTITLRPVGAGECIAEGNKINIVFTDGSKIDLVNDAFTNCRGEATANFGGQFGRKKQFEELKTKKIKSIKVWTQTGSVQQELNPENREEFHKVINCLDQI